MPTVNQLIGDLQKLANPKQASILQKFFKTGPGQYGEGDIFLGIKTPAQRQAAKKYNNLPLTELAALLKNKIHDYRSVALAILAGQYQKADADGKKQIFNFYLNHLKYINNWDLVDMSAPKIIGDYLINRPRQVLYRLATATNLWQRRVAIISTYAFIRKNDFATTLKIAKILLNDEHDLIHKAVGWMLREAGKRDQKTEEKFLKKYYQKMPRTMLRYAIEKFPPKKRKFYLTIR